MTFLQGWRHLFWTHLRAPISGTINAIAVRVGDQIAAGTIVATVAPVAARRARFGIDPDLARQIRIGSPVSIAIANGNSAIDAAVQSIDIGTDPTNRLASVYVDLPPPVRIGAGEALAAELTINASSQLPTIPYTALLDEAGQSYVFVIRNGKAYRANVTVGSRSADRVAIASGIQAGALVAVDGGSALEDGMKVSIR